MIFAIGSAHAQYKGKYVGWSAGYIFTGSTSQVSWKAFTHLLNFQVTVSTNGSINPGSLAMNSQQFVTACHQHGVKALVCIGGAGESPHFSAATSSAGTQTILVKNILNLVRSGGYDGVDMDWEAGEENDNPGMVTKFKSLHKELRDSINKMTPRPMMTAAVATDWYPNCTSAIAPYVDQLNNMSYYNRVKDMDGLFKPVLDKGVAKNIQGVGFGFDTDNEITDVADIAAKCRYSIDNGYGGIMVWDITHAPASTMDTVARYVSLSYTTGISTIQNTGSNGAVLSVQRDDLTGRNEISYSVASNLNGGWVDLGLYVMQGSLVRQLAHGRGEPGLHKASFDLGGAPGRSVKPGAYVVRLATDANSSLAKTVFFR
ncbi:MAG: chiB1 [Verrucomicrobiales bacterium]|nr:chiB1 [Verrucomicrobiales bacterium]